MENEKKRWLSQDYVTLLILAMPFVFVAIFWDQFPERIPIHYDGNFKPDRYAGKTVGLLLLPAINVALYGFFKLMPIIDPYRKNYGLFNQKFKAIQVLLHLFLAYIFFIIGFEALGYDLSLETMLPYGVLVFFIVMGNYMGTVRRNYFLGIRTPWTLASDEVWVKTHRFTAKLWVSASLSMFFILLFYQHLQWLFYVYLAVIILAPLVYSYVLYRKLPQQNGAH